MQISFAWKYHRLPLIVLFPFLLCACQTPFPPLGTTPVQSARRPSAEAAPFIPLYPITSQDDSQTKKLSMSSEGVRLRQLLALQFRLNKVSGPLFLQNAELCRNGMRYLLGFTAKNQYSYSENYIDAAKRTLHLGERLQVTSVLAKSGAAKVGIMPGDQLVAVENKPIPQGRQAEKETALLLAPLVNQLKTLSLTIKRHGRQQVLQVPLTRACGFAIELGHTQAINSYADGQRILITLGMMRFIQSDDELAYVIAKEMAHNALQHPSKQRDTRARSAMIDRQMYLHPVLAQDQQEALQGIKPYSKAFDVAADKLALEMLIRAKIDINHALAFWERLRHTVPATVANGYTALHPETAARLAEIQKIVAEMTKRKPSHHQ